MKKVFSSSDQVFHLWANQVQSEARSKNVFFKEDKIYSYGYHYELGRIVEYNSQKIALINDDGYSVTTSKHISQARSSARHLIVLNVSGDQLKRIGPDTSQFKYLKDIIFESVLKQQDSVVSTLFNHFSRKKFWTEPKWDEYNEDNLKDFNSLCDKLNFKDLKINVDLDFINLHNEYIQERIQRELFLNSPEEQAKKAAKQLKKHAKELEKQKEQIQAWVNGGPIVESVRRLEPQVIRINNNEVQTSRGASVPLDHAMRLLMLIENNAYKTVERVGHFQLDAINGDRIKIGCHNLSLEQCKSVLLNNINLKKEA